MGLRDLYAQQLQKQGFRPDPIQSAVIGQLEQLRERLIAAHEARSGTVRRLLDAVGARQSQPAVRGMYLWGGVGRGKTWMMDLFFQSLPFPERRRRHFHRFMHDVHATLRTLQQRSEPLETVAEQIARDTQILCFDELYVSDIADAMILGGLFAGLLRRGVTLVATSNTPPQDLYKEGLQRQRFLPTIALLQENLDIIAVEGKTDYRLRQLTQAGTYLLTDRADTRQRLASLFNELAHQGNTEADPPATGGSIEIEGRDIPIVREAGGVVWFSFDALCSGPRSQEDYIEIARNYHSVILSDVPLLDELHENEARRFISLVDELYDRRVNLIVSAAQSPQHLYRGSRVAQPFERTVSRLIEMQSDEYLASEHRP